MNLPSISSYGNYSSDNYGAHALRVEMPNVTVYFSYKTPVAFRSNKGGGTVVRQNDWGTTTGKHLNAIDGGSREAKKARVDSATFERLFGELVAAH